MGGQKHLSKSSNASSTRTRTKSVLLKSTSKKTQPKPSTYGRQNLPRSLVDLWKRNEEKPLKVRMDGWLDAASWYELIGFTPVGIKESIGWHLDGVVIGYDPKQTIWRKHESQ